MMMNQYKALLFPLAIFCACLTSLHLEAAIPPKGHRLFSITGTVKNGKGLAFNEAGRLFVVDQGSTPPNIKVFDRCGNFLFAVGNPGFTFLRDVAVNKKGQIIVLEGSNSGNVFVFDSRGHFLFKFQASSSGSTAIAVDEFERIYAFGDNPKLAVFDRCGIFLFDSTSFDGTSASITANSDAQIITSSSSNQTLTVHDRAGVKLFEVDLPYKPVGVAVNGAGQIFVAAQDQANPIKVYDRCGNFLFDFGAGFVDVGNIFDVAVNADGLIAVSQGIGNNGEIVVFE